MIALHGEAADAGTIDCGGKLVLPGLIDTHAHWLGTVYVENITNTLGVNAITDPAF